MKGLIKRIEERRKKKYTLSQEEFEKFLAKYEKKAADAKLGKKVKISLLEKRLYKRHLLFNADKLIEIAKRENEKNKSKK